MLRVTALSAPSHGRVAPGFATDYIPLPVLPASSSSCLWRVIPSGSHFCCVHKQRNFEPRHRPPMGIAITPGFNTLNRFSRGCVVVNNGLRIKQGNAPTCSIPPSTKNNTCARRLQRVFLHSQMIRTFGSIESRKKRCVGCRCGGDQVEVHPIDEQQLGETELTDAPLVDETTDKATVQLTDQTLEPEKEKTLTRSVELTAAGYFTLALGALLFVDCRLPRITQRTLAPYFLTTPFLVSAAISAISGYICVPVLRKIKVAQVFRKEGPTAHLVKSGTPTMGGLFFVPVGLAVAAVFNRTAAIEVHGTIVMTLVYAGIGLLDDGLALLRKHNYGLPGRIKLLLQVVSGILFFLWLKSANVSSPNITKDIVPLPAPLGHLHLGKWYMALTAFCCAAMSNGVNLTDGLDGLAGGTVAASFLGMAVALLPSCPALGSFGSSMAGACFGFLVHNRYKAKVFMGDTGSLALGGALASMAVCSGMFFPLFIASGVFVVETVSVMGQVFYFQLTTRLHGQGRRWLRMAPFHHHLEFLGFSETRITTLAYALSIILSIAAAYSGLVVS